MHVVIFMAIMDEQQLVYDSCIRGYHVFKEIWIPTLGHELLCEPEFRNIRDAYAVAVQSQASLRGDMETVGHVPRKISAPSCLFIRRGGVIICQVTGRRRYSADLVNGGLEVPCTYTFVGTGKEIRKVKSVLESCPTVIPNILPPASKKAKFIDHTCDGDTEDECDTVWLRFQGQFMTESDKNGSIEGDLLNDRHINYAQQLS